MMTHGLARIYHTETSLFSTLFNSSINYLNSYVSISSIYILLYWFGSYHAFNCST